MKTSTIVAIVVILILVAVGGYLWYLEQTRPKPPTGEVVLKVRGKITKTNVGDEYHFDLKMLEELIDTEYDWECPWFGMHHWEGISLVKFLDVVGAAPDAKYIKFVAKDGLTAEFPIDLIKSHPKIMLALKVDGEIIPDEMVGPLRVVIPYDQYPELNETYPAFPYTIGWVVEAEVGG